MVRYLLPNSDFPDPLEADENGLVAVGGRLTSKTILAAYSKGIFPWYSRPPILWYSLAPRMVIIPDELHVGRTLRSVIKKKKFRITLDTCFQDVVLACSQSKRPGQYGTWLNTNMIVAYCKLHHEGYTHSCEAWLDGELVGGLYGVSLGKVFYGESMFTKCNDASKVAFVHLTQQLQKWKFCFIDCQMYTEHMARFGGIFWSRETFQKKLSAALEYPSRTGKWAFDNESD